MENDVGESLDLKISAARPGGDPPSDLPYYYTQSKKPPLLVDSQNNKGFFLFRGGLKSNSPDEKKNH